LYRFGYEGSPVLSLGRFALFVWGTIWVVGRSARDLSRPPGAGKFAVTDSRSRFKKLFQELVSASNFENRVKTLISKLGFRIRFLGPF